MPLTRLHRENGDPLLSDRQTAYPSGAFGIFRAISFSPRHGLVPNVPTRSHDPLDTKVALLRCSFGEEVDFTRCNPLFETTGWIPKCF